MRMQKRKFRIGQLAKHLNVERFVIRFWEKEFQLKPSRSHGGQRFYDENDLATFTLIKDLLYKKCFTISGAKKQLAITNNTVLLASQKTTMDIPQKKYSKESETKKIITEQIADLQKKLIKLRELL